MSEHTPAPYVIFTRTLYGRPPTGDEAICVLCGPRNSDEKVKANGRRLLALLDACQSIPTAALEAGVVAEMRETLAEYLDWHEINFQLPSGNFEDPDQQNLARRARTILAKLGQADG